MVEMQNNDTLLHEVTLKISTNDCFGIGDSGVLNFTAD